MRAVMKHTKPGAIHSLAQYYSFQNSLNSTFVGRQMYQPTL